MGSDWATWVGSRDASASKNKCCKLCINQGAFWQLRIGIERSFKGRNVPKSG